MLSPYCRVLGLSAVSLWVLGGEAVAQPWDGEQHWGIGAHASGVGLSASDAEGDEARSFELGGGGIQLRYRLNWRWSFEAEIDGVSGQLEDNGPTRRSSGLGLAAIFHINPYQAWTWHVLAGFGGGRDDIRFLEFVDDKPMRGEVSFSHGMFQLGGGVERRFRKFGVGIELRLLGMTRNDDDLDGPAFEGMDEPAPREESGGRFNLYANYYF